MKKEWAMKWIKALRSGEFHQAKNRLRVGDNYCCLGVLTVLVDPNHPDLGEQYESAGTVLPIDIRNVTGIKTFSGSFRSVNLSGRNDTGSTFEEIADLIEKYWEKL
jgi:hypothetical protein